MAKRKTAATNPDQKLIDLKIELPTLHKPAGKYRRGVICGDMLYLSQHSTLDLAEGGGEVGHYLGQKRGGVVVKDWLPQFTRLVGEIVLRTVKDTVGDLTRVKKLVRFTTVMYMTESCELGNSAFQEAMDAFTDLMIEVFGPESGVSARALLPTFVPDRQENNVALVHISECIFELHPPEEEF